MAEGQVLSNGPRLMTGDLKKGLLHAQQPLFLLKHYIF